MSPHTVRRSVAGPAGAIEVALDGPPAGAPLGWAVIGHPHPLYGGTMDNKVAATLARALAGAGWLAIRFNFRGVGASAGVHDHGSGETADLLHLIDSAPAWAADRLPAPGAPLALAGFSFGSFVVASAAQQLAARGVALRHLILVGCAAGKWPMPAVSPTTLVIHGEVDETIPLADVFAWARPQHLPVVVLPGADHFFHGRLGQLKALVQRELAAGAAPAP